MWNALVPGLAVFPGQSHSVHLTSVPLPDVGSMDALVRVKQVGFCGTDREITEGKFGTAPLGSHELVIGHEVIGVVERIGDGVSTMRPGDLVSATVRRPCGCVECQRGEVDFCSRRRYLERGIVGLHGYMTERFVESVDYLVPVPQALERIGVLVEPLSVPEKVWRVATAVQSRLSGWRPRTAAVFGAGPIGILTTLMLRERGLDVWALDLKPAPNPAERIVHAAGGTYLCVAETTIASMRSRFPPVDLIVECTGSSVAVPQAMELLGNNGVLVLLSGTGGDRELTVPMDRLNREFVLGNKLMVGSVNSTACDFQRAIADLENFERLWPGLTESIITQRLRGLEEALSLPDSTYGHLKSVVDVAE